jgi:hypothetical protein
MASEKNNLDRRGWFEELYFGVGIAFDRSDPSVVNWLATDVTAGGLLDWTAAAAALQRSDREKAKKARLTAVSYLFESVAGVLLDPSTSINLNQGFEQFLQYGKSNSTASGEDKREDD